jgi:hypothetical protein
MQAVEEKFVKQLRTATLIALALSAVAAVPAFAATTGSSSGIVVAITAEGPSITSLYNGVALTTTSVTFGSLLTGNGLNLGTIGDILGSLGNSQGGNWQGGGFTGFNDSGYSHFPIFAGGPSTSPIPEGRALLLYAAGFSLVAWAIQRSQRAH